jgi:hypothetical protein
MKRPVDHKSRKRAREAIPPLSLTYAQVLWILRELGFAHDTSYPTFAHYVKSLRRLGVPFENRGLTGPKRREAYKYEPIMELAIALALRVYATLPDVIPATLRNHRERLYPIYRQALLERRSDLGAPIQLGGSVDAEISGIFLELRLKFVEGRLIQVGSPVALGPKEAVERFASGDITGRSWLPLNLSKLASRILEVAARAPGPRQLRTPKRSRVSPLRGPLETS